MARPVYSTRFVALHGGGPANYFVPAGYTAVLRCITYFNPDALLSSTSSVTHTTSNCTIDQKDVIDLHRAGRHAGQA